MLPRVAGIDPRRVAVGTCANKMKGPGKTPGPTTHCPTPAATGQTFSRNRVPETTRAPKTSDTSKHVRMLRHRGRSNTHCPLPHDGLFRKRSKNVHFAQAFGIHPIAKYLLPSLFNFLENLENSQRNAAQAETLCTTITAASVACIVKRCAAAIMVSHGDGGRIRFRQKFCNIK